MKKKKANLERKLTLSKETVASLNMLQQQKIAGGFVETRLTACPTYFETCHTAIVRTGPCYECPTI
ncbi:class I lanthipeptide [Chitinophaga sp. HK235]|uniref:class I lanthipeptide n=1 Tax=Chitinophaga sp. HK235 TaxID=2952571 RepID=UPI001BA7F55F|nr:class I lanthipeptide [Chitinophaga sp. HK235]